MVDRWYGPLRLAGRIEQPAAAAVVQHRGTQSGNGQPGRPHEGPERHRQCIWRLRLLISFIHSPPFTLPTLPLPPHPHPQRTSTNTTVFFYISSLAVNVYNTTRVFLAFYKQTTSCWLIVIDRIFELCLVVARVKHNEHFTIMSSTNSSAETWSAVNPKWSGSIPGDTSFIFHVGL